MYTFGQKKVKQNFLKQNNFITIKYLPIFIKNYFWRHTEGKASAD
jgi:hypothetical protein